MNLGMGKGSGTGAGESKKEGLKKTDFERENESGISGSEKRNKVDLGHEHGSKEKTREFFDSPIWLSTKDAAIYLRKFRRIDGQPSEGAIRTAIWRGELKARKWRRRLYIRKADLDRLLQNAPFASGGYGWA